MVEEEVRGEQYIVCPGCKQLEVMVADDLPKLCPTCLLKDESQITGLPEIRKIAPYTFTCKECDQHLMMTVLQRRGILERLQEVWKGGKSVKKALREIMSNQLCQTHKEKYDEI